MRFSNGIRSVTLFILLFALVVSVPAYSSDEEIWPISRSYSGPPILASVDVKAGVLIGPIVVRTSMTGTVKLIGPGDSQSLSVKMGADGFSRDVNLGVEGNYTIEENYELSVELYFDSIRIEAVKFPENHVWIYSNQVSGIKTFKVESKLKYTGSNIQGPIENLELLEVYSVQPSVVEPGVGSASVMLRALDNIKKDDIFASAVTVNCLWEKTSSLTSENSPPSVQIVSPPIQAKSNDDVKITFTLKDVENARCVIEAAYKKSAATSWVPATISGGDVYPGSGTLYWKSAMDEPNGQGLYDIRIRASDGLAYSSWSSRDVTINNIAADENHPPDALNVHIKVIDGATNQEVAREPITGDRLRAGYTFNDIDNDSESGSMLRWYKNGQLISGEQSKTLSQTVRKGDSWYFTIKPSDGKTAGTQRESTRVTVGNAPPRVQSVHIEPSVPSSKDDLRLVYIYSDPDNDPEGDHEILWYKDGNPQPFYDNLNPLPADATAKGDEWRVSILARDDDGASAKDPMHSSQVTVMNQKPRVEIVSVSGSRDDDGDLFGDITVTYNLKDDDGDFCRLVVWYWGGSVGMVKTHATLAESADSRLDEGVINDVAPADGLKLTWKSNEDEATEKADNYRIEVIPYNVFDFSATEMGVANTYGPFSVDNNEEPVVTGVAISPSSPFSADKLTASYEFQDPDGDAESGTEIEWYKNGAKQTQYSSLKELPGSATKRDENWYFIVKPKDGKEFGRETKSPTVKIKNSPPVAAEVKLEPANPGSDDNLNAIYTYEDADDDPEVDVQIRWYLNNELKSQYNDRATIPSQDTVKGQAWHFTIQVSDGIIAGELVKSNVASVGNVAPEVRGLSVPEEGFHDVTIKFDLVDSDDDKCRLTVEYQGGLASTWTQATIKEPLTDLSPGLITLTWESAKDVNVKDPAKFKIRITPSDGLVTGQPVESDFLTLDNNIPPVASNLNISPANPTTVDNLAASYNYSDADGGVEGGSEVLWYVDNTQTSYRGKTLLASATLRGQFWHFTVRPRDGTKFGDLQISSPVTIRNSPPTVLDPAIAPVNPKAGDALSVRYSYRDLDQDKEAGTEIEWYKNDLLELKKTVVTDADKNLPVPAAKGEKWYAIIRPKDGADFGEPVTTAPVSVGNALPAVEDVQVSVDANNVTITFSLIDSDGDPCDLDVRYQGGSVGSVWTLATISEPIAKVSPGTGLKLTWLSNADEAGQKAGNYKIRITPNDGIAEGKGGISNTFTLSSNTLPTAVDLAILPGAPVTSDSLQVSYTFVDPDGDTEDRLKLRVRWYKDGSPDARYDNLTVLPSSATTKGDRWHYTISVSDGKDYSKTQLSPAVTIRNAPPSVDDVVLTPNNPNLDEQLVASYDYIDADGDPEMGTQIRWYRNGSQLPAYDDSKVIPGIVTLSGDLWYFTVVPKDGFDFGIPESSNEVFIANMPPSASSLRILPASPLTTDELLASYIYMDPESDPEVGSRIIWYRNSVAQPQYNDMLQLPAIAIAKKQVWHFSVRPKDGKQFGLEQQSGFVVIGNTPPRVSNLSISPAYPLSKDDLVASYDFSDVDTDLEGRSEIRWYKNGVWIQEYGGLKSLPDRATLNGERWYFTVRPTDGTDFGDEETSPEVEIGSPVPRVNNLSIMPGNPVTTDDLTAIYIYTDPNGIPEAGSLITWHKNGVAQTEYSNSKVLPWDATFKGEQWYFSVRPSNGRDLGQEQSSVPVTILNSPPVLIEVLAEPSHPTTDDKLVVSYVFNDSDGDVEARNEIKWFRNGTLQSGYNNMTELLAMTTKRGEEWHFTIRSSDGTEFSELVTSTSVIIGNGLPEVINVNILPAAPLTHEDLELLYDFLDTEEDPESGSEIRWFKNDIHEDYDNAQVVPARATVRGDYWYCTIRPRDGIDFGDTVKSPVVTIDNTPPWASEIFPASDQVLRGRTVIISSNGEDADSIDTGPALTCKIQFRFGIGAWISLPTEYVETTPPHWEAVFSPDAGASLGEYDFRSSFIDPAGGESDWILQEKMVTVTNNSPVIDASTDDFHVPEDTVTEFDLRDRGTDLEDGKNVIWTLDAASVNTDLFQVSIMGNRFLEIKPLDNKNGEDDITLTLTDTDEATIVKTDVTIIIDPLNDAPTMPALVSIEPESPKTSENLACTAEGSTDIDADTVVYRYQWYKNGELQPGLNSRSVSYARTSKGELWRCEVIPSDGVSDGPSRSAEVNVFNTLPEVTVRKVDGNVNDIVITFDLKDADDDSCDLKVEYLIRGRTWRPATVAVSAGLPASPGGVVREVKPGTDLSLIWQSRIDEEGVMTDDCKVKITPNDGTIPANPKESESFSLDNKPPEFTVTAVTNPIHDYYIDVNVVSDEDLAAAPAVSAALGEEQALELDVQSIGDNIWTGKFTLEPGFNGSVLFTVEGSDLVGNTGRAEIQKTFQIPLPLPRPTSFSVGQNYPNPFIENTNIPYELPESSNVIIEIYSLTGQLVKTMDEGYKVAGFYVSQGEAAYWDGTDDNGNMVASGVYFYHLKAGNFEGPIKKMAVSR